MMKHKNLIFLSIIFSTSAFYAMDQKKYVSQLQIIHNNQTLISFKKKTKSFEDWMLHKRDTLFGENRLFEYLDKHVGITAIQTVTIPADNNRNIYLAYISNLEKRYVDHKKFVMLGAFLLYDSCILKDDPVTMLTNYYAQKIPKSIRPQKSFPQKQTQERGSIIMQNLFELIETYGKPDDLHVVTTTEDLELLRGNSPKKYSAEEAALEEQPEIRKKSKSSLSRRPSGHIPKLSARKFSTKKPKVSGPDKTD